MIALANSKRARALPNAHWVSLGLGHLLGPLLAPLLGALFAAWLLSACSTAPQSGAMSPFRVTDAGLDPDVFRITVRWPARIQPGDPEPLLLTRAAELAQKARARFFFVVNASAPIQNTEWLAEGSVVAPTQIVPIPQLHAEMDLPDGMLVAVIRIFRSGAAAKGYPLYDAERILRERSKRAA